MLRTSSLLKAGVFYLIAVSVAHFFQWKVPGLFIYDRVPSYLYQDRLIASLALGLALLLWGLSNEPELSRGLRTAIAASAAALVAGLVANNFFSGRFFRETPRFWGAISTLAVYAALLIKSLLSKK